ncbi:MAG: LTA synthase family protein, partial [Puniceicoccales bacterium]|nr:LTA synthase family protein [Puniceicoccales bacterium]
MNNYAQTAYKWLINFIHRHIYPISLILSFALEAFVVQELTIPSLHNNITNALATKLLRALINLSFSTFLVSVFFGKCRVLLYIVSILEFILSLVFLTYYGYFKVPITLTVIISQIHEFIKISDVAIPLISPTVFLMLTLSLLIKFFIISRLKNNNYKTNPFLILLSLIFLSFLIQISLQSTLQHNFLYVLDMDDRIPEAYGYLNAFTISGLNMLNNGQNFCLTTQKLYNDRRNDTQLYAPIKPFKNIIVVQVESLDYSVLGMESNGKEVMPFLNSVTKSAIVKKIFSRHHGGSANSDYQCLTGAESPKIYTYALHTKLDFSKFETLPRKFKKFKSVSYHGCTGSFFSRKIPYTKMGFQETYFLEDFESIGFKGSKMGILDGDVFNFAIDRLNTSKNDHNFIFIITLTSHCDFDMTPSKNVYPEGEDDALWKKYINSINYVDQCFCKLYEKMPKDTVLVLYGDHWSYTDYDGVSMDEVPLVIFQKGNDIHNGIILKTTNDSIKLHDIHWIICDLMTKYSSPLEEPS